MIKEKSRTKENIIGILTKEGGEKIMIKGYKGGFNVLAIVRDKFGKIKSMVKGKNIVTNDGDLFYAENGCEEAPTNAFANCFLGTSVVAEAKDDDWSDLTFIADSEKAPTATYPKTDDQDADNSGKAVDSITYMYEWTGADFNDAAIGCGGIAVAAASGTDPLLTRFKFAAAFAKTATDTLTLFVNHNFLGV